MELLQQQLDGEADVSFQNVDKPNQLTVPALSIRAKDSDISRLFYIRDYYEHFCSGMSLDDIAGGIVQAYHKDSAFGDSDLLSLKDILTDYESVRDRLCVRMVHYEKNREYLADKYFIPKLDFALCLCYLVKPSGERIATLTLPKSIVTDWGQSAEILFEKAFENMASLMPAWIAPMEDTLDRLYRELDSFSRFMNPPDFSKGFELYILSNEQDYYGASAMFYKDLLKDFCERERYSQLIIIPVSLHEVLFTPLDRNNPITPSHAQNYLHSLQKDSLTPDLFLSDRIYLYDYATDKLDYFEGNGI